MTYKRKRRQNAERDFEKIKYPGRRISEGGIAFVPDTNSGADVQR